LNEHFLEARGGIPLAFKLACNRKTTPIIVFKTLNKRARLIPSNMAVLLFSAMFLSVSWMDVRIYQVDYKFFDMNL